ncbi:MAG: methyltransferase domain-containing protein [Labilithrix sp.]|nr:methyltransferase domain-containing protein [Labilithrix sp.]
MSGVRAAERADLDALEALVAAVPDMPARARDAARSALRGAVDRPAADGANCLVAFGDDGAARAFACTRAVPLARDTTDIEWLVAIDDDAPSRVRDLVACLRDGALFAPATVRFLSGRWQRAGLDSHVLDAAGMTRAGAIDSFFGRGDDLVVFVARGARRAAEAFDPMSSAALCDAAFAYRDFAFERDFLLACAARHGTRRVRRAASWGCWAGRHLRALAERGIDGVGIDEASAALALAEAAYEAEESASRATWVLSRLDESVQETPVDLSFAMLSAVHRVGSAESMVRHLRSVADLLAPGGVHVIEATLPVDATPEGNARTVWTERRGDLEITSRFHILIDRRTARGAVPTVLDVRCRKHGSQDVIGSFHQDELWLVPDAEGWRDLVARAGRFDFVGILGDFHLDVAWDQPGAWRMIVVLRRVEEASAR